MDNQLAHITQFKQFSHNRQLDIFSSVNNAILDPSLRYQSIDHMLNDRPDVINTLIGSNTVYNQLWRTAFNNAVKYAESLRDTDRTRYVKDYIFAFYWGNGLNNPYYLTSETMQRVRCKVESFLAKV